MISHCHGCGQVYLVAEQICKKCGTPLVTETARAQLPAANLASNQLSNQLSDSGPPSLFGYLGVPFDSHPITRPQGVWRDEDIMVIEPQATLPDRCIKCNQPADGQRIKAKFKWHHSAIYLLLLVHPLVYIVISSLLKRVTTVELGICQHHLEERRKAIATCSTLTLAGLIGVVLSIFHYNVATTLPVGLLFLFLSFCYYLSRARIIATRIDDRGVRLRGVDEDYLAQLPAVEHH